VSVSVCIRLCERERERERLLLCVVGVWTRSMNEFFLCGWLRASQRAFVRVSEHVSVSPDLRVSGCARVSLRLCVNASASVCL
jgi:hypothetical protein